MTYYGYVSPDINKEVNWAKIGTDFADMLNKGEQEREKKRQQIDKDTDEFIKTVNNTPQGQYKRLNEWTIDYSADVKKSMLLLNKELKAGRLDPDQFIKFRQNLIDGTESIFNLSKTFQQEYDEIERRRLSTDPKDKGSYLESWVAQQVEKLGRFSESKPVINPIDYNVYVGQLVDGKLDTNPNNVQSPAVLTGLLKTRYNAYDIMGNANKIASAAGKEIQVVDKGAIRRILDITKRRDLSDVDKNDRAIGLYMRLEDAAISSALSDPDSITSVLLDGKTVNGKTGNAYEPTSDPNDPGIKTGDKIYMEFDKGSGRYISKPTEEQTKAAKNVMRDAIRYQLDREEEGKAQFAPQSRTSSNSNRPTANDMTGLGMLRFLYSGNDSQMAQARNYFQNRGIYVKRTSTGVVGEIIGPDKTRKPFSLSFLSLDNKTPIGEDEWVASASPILTGELDVMKAIRYGGQRGALGGLNTSATWSTAPAKTPKTKDVLWKEEVNRIIPPDKQYTGGSTKATKALVSEFQSQFGQYDFTFTSAGTILKIETPSSGDVEIDTDVPGWMGKIKTAISNGLTGEDLKKFGPGSY